MATGKSPTPASQDLQQSNAAARPGLRKPVFVKVEQLKPGTNGHTLIVKVVSSNTVLQKGRSVSQHLRQTRIAECLVGDETGTILFTARNDQGMDFGFCHCCLVSGNFGGEGRVFGFMSSFCVNWEGEIRYRLDRSWGPNQWLCGLGYLNYVPHSDWNLTFSYTYNSGVETRK